MPPKVATVQAPFKCPYCNKFFARLNQHFAAPSPCRDLHEAEQEAFHTAALQSRGRYDPDEVDDTDEPSGHDDMDIDTEFVAGGTWEFPSSPEGPGPSKRMRTMSPDIPAPAMPTQTRQPPPPPSKTFSITHY
jgi:hypothetical protein